MRIGYFADGPWSHRAMEKLLANKTIEIVFVCARHDLQDPILKEIAGDFGLPFFSHPNVNENCFLEKIISYRCDLLVSMSFNQIFQKNIIEVPPLGIINCHAGKLPFYRGRNVLNWALINDETEFGITVHYVDDEIDTGDIIRQELFPITDKDDYRTLLERAYVGCADLLVQAIEDIQKGVVKKCSQQSIHPLGFYCSARVPGDERLDWNQSSRQVFNFVRAICPPGPSALCFLGDDKVKINKVELLFDAPFFIGVPGAVLERKSDSFLVKTQDSFVRVLDWDTVRNIKIGDRLK